MTAGRTATLNVLVSIFKAHARAKPCRRIRTNQLITLFPSPGNTGRIACIRPGEGGKTGRRAMKKSWKRVILASLLLAAPTLSAAGDTVPGGPMNQSLGDMDYGVCRGTD